MNRPAPARDHARLAALRVRQPYTAAKAAPWRARAGGHRAAEQDAAAAEVLQITGQLPAHDKETHR